MTASSPIADDMRRIVLLITNLGRGGAETQVVRLALGLKSRGWSVAVVALMTPQDFVQELEGAGISVTALHLGRGMGRTMIGLPAALRVLRKLQPSLLVAFNFPAEVVARLCGRLAGIRVVIVSVRTTLLGGVARRLVYRFGDFLVTAVAANSEAVRRELEKLGVGSGKLFTIPNGIDVTAWKVSDDLAERRRTEIGVGRDSFLWLAVGNVRDAKDYPSLIGAVRHCVDAGDSIHLCIAGAETLDESMRQLVVNAGLKDHVTLLGKRKDVAALLCIADAFVLSSAWEGMPNALMEAMACGKPVVATNVGGVSELVEEGLSGFVVPLRDPRMLASAMRKLMQLAPAQRRHMGQAGRQIIQDRFSVELLVDRWEALSWNVLNPGKSAQEAHDGQ